MANLQDLLGQPRPAVVADVEQIVNTNISSQKGLTGIALKGAVATAEKIDAQIVTKGINTMLPELIEALSPQWEAFQTSGETDFGAYLSGRQDEVADSILVVADRNAEAINVPALAKTYKTLRGKAAGMIKPQIPAIGNIIQKHMAA